jgi:CopG family transcriptional regulator, nickel-responsive regulator
MLKRFTVSMEENLLDDFDNFIKDRNYRNRSEALRDLIRGRIIEKEWQADKDVMGVISLVYDHHQHKLQEKVTELQHDFHSRIISTTHVHMDHHNCLEVIIVRGKAGEVRNLSNNLKAMRGVRNCSLSMSSTGKDLH